MNPECDNCGVTGKFAIANDTDLDLSLANMAASDDDSDDKEDDKSVEETENGNMSTLATSEASADESVLETRQSRRGGNPVRKLDFSPANINMSSIRCVSMRVWIVDICRAIYTLTSRTCAESMSKRSGRLRPTLLKSKS